MVVKKLFKDTIYPMDINERTQIVDEYNKKMNLLINKESASKDFKMSLIFEFITLLCAVFVFMYGDVSIVLKLLYVVPAVVFTVYDFSILCKVKKENYNNDKHLYKKHISQLFIFVLIIYVGTYMFAAISLDDKFTTVIAFISWGVLMVLSIGSLLKARKDAPDKFLNTYLNPDKKYHAQPSWALNITRALIILVSLFKPYMLLITLAYIIISPLVYVVTYSYYVYLQYDEIQQLIK